MGCKRKDLTLDYRQHPKSQYPYSSFDERIEDEADNMFWEAARSFIMLEDNACPPAYWDFVIRTSDFWHYRTTSKNPAPCYVAQIGDFEKILACGHWEEIFGIYEQPPSVRRELAGSWVLPRRDAVQSDLLHLWQYATTSSNRSLPLAKVESAQEARYVIETASKELGIEGLVMAYAAGVPMEDILISQLPTTWTQGS